MLPYKIVNIFLLISDNLGCQNYVIKYYDIRAFRFCACELCFRNVFGQLILLLLLISI